MSKNAQAASQSVAKPTQPVPIDILRNLISKWLHIPSEDHDLIDVSLAVYKSNEIPGDPLWLIIIDASGGGKTELLRTLHNRHDAYFLSKLTENSLVSGYRDQSEPDKDPSILPQLDGKVLVIKDLAPLLSMRRESRNAIIGDLRDAYDGFTDHGKGNLGKQSYKSRFTLIAASTLAIERADAIDQELGERFIKVRARGNASFSKVRKAVENLGSDETMRAEIESAISQFLSALPSSKCATIPGALREELAELADFTARGRSAVARDKRGELQYCPRPEVGTRLVKELGKLLLSLAVVRGKGEPDAEDLSTVRRVAEDCLPPNRFAVLTALRSASQPLRFCEIEDATRLSHGTSARTLDDLNILGLVESSGEAADFARRWRIGDERRP